MISAINSKESKAKKNFLRENKTRLKLLQQRNTQIKDDVQVAQQAKPTKKARKIIPKKLVIPDNLPSEPVEKSFEELGVQINENNFKDDEFMNTGTVLLPSPSVVSYIDEMRKMKMNETTETNSFTKKEKKFEGHSTHLKSHLSNLREFLDSGSVSSRRKAKELEDNFDIDNIVKHLGCDNTSSELVPNGIEADDYLSVVEGTSRIQQKKQELLLLIDKF